MKKIGLLFLLAFPFTLFSCGLSPAITNYDEGNNLEYSTSEISNIHIDMRLGQDQGHIIFNQTENKDIKISGVDASREDYKFRYYINNKNLYIREAKIEEGEKRSSSYLQTIEFFIPKNFVVNELHFNSANSVLEINNVTFNKINAVANGKQIHLNKVTANNIYAQTWTGGMTFNDVKANNMFLTTTYANINLNLTELPQKTECIATSGEVNIQLPEDTTNFTVYPGNKTIDLRFEHTVEEYQDEDVTKTKYIVGNGEKEIHFSGKNDHLHIFYNLD